MRRRLNFHNRHINKALFFHTVFSFVLCLFRAFLLNTTFLLCNASCAYLFFGKPLLLHALSFMPFILCTISLRPYNPGSPATQPDILFIPSHQPLLSERCPWLFTLPPSALASLRPPEPSFPPSSMPDCDGGHHTWRYRLIHKAPPFSWPLLLLCLGFLRNLIQRSVHQLQKLQRTSEIAASPGLRPQHPALPCGILPVLDIYQKCGSLSCLVEDFVCAFHNAVPLSVRKSIPIQTHPIS